MNFDLSVALKNLRAQPKEKRRLLSLIVLGVAIPLLVGIWFLSIQASLKNIALNPDSVPAQETLGPKLLRITGEFFAKVGTGINNFFRSLATASANLNLGARLYSFWLKVLGRPEIKALPSASPMPLPVAS